MKPSAGRFFCIFSDRNHPDAADHASALNFSVGTAAAQFLRLDMPQTRRIMDRHITVLFHRQFSSRTPQPGCGPFESACTLSPVYQAHRIGENPCFFVKKSRVFRIFCTSLIAAYFMATPHKYRCRYALDFTRFSLPSYISLPQNQVPQGVVLSPCRSRGLCAVQTSQSASLRSFLFPRFPL